MRPWDEGVRWHIEQVTAPDVANEDSLSLAFVRDDHLRAVNGDAEDDFIRRLLKTSYRMAERATWRAHLQQTWAMVLDRFPCGDIVLPKPPLRSVTSITYTDDDGIEQELLGSPAGLEFQVSTPDGPKAPKGRIRPLYDETWPSTRRVLDAVRIEFVCGYPLVGTYSIADVPEDIDHGRLLVIGDMYKQRSESVIGFGVSVNPAIVRARDLWAGYRAW